MKDQRFSFGEKGENAHADHDLREDLFAFARLEDKKQDVFLSRELMKSLDTPLREGDAILVGYVVSPKGYTAVFIEREARLSAPR